MTFKRRERDEFDVLSWVLIAAMVVAVIAGLIEFNARRQAAALTRELTRAPTAEEQQEQDRQLKAMEQRWQAEADAERPEMLRRLWGNPQTATQSATPPQPLKLGERCINHQRFQRVSNGWVQIGSC